MARLGDICTVKSGYAFKSEHFSDEGIPVIRIGNITNDGLSLEDAVCFDEDFWENNSNYRVHPNDILVAMSGATVGKSCLNESNEKLLLNQRVAAITAGNGVNVKYIFHIINSDYFTNYVLQNSAGCAQPNISTKQLMNFEIRDVSRIIQDSIANTLDAVDELISLRKEQLAKLDQLVKSRFIELFGDPNLNDKGWLMGVINDIGACIAGATPSTQVKEYWENGTIPWMSSGEVNKGRVFETDTKITQLGYDNASTKLVPPKTVVLAMAGQGRTRGTAAITEIELCTNQSICSIVNNEKVHAEYLLYFLKLQYMELRGASTNTDGRGGLNLKIIGNYPIMIPPMVLQKQFAAFVEQTDKSKLAIQQSLEKLETLKKSLMQEYFG